jgi:hypothetical protein
MHMTRTLLVGLCAGAVSISACTTQHGFPFPPGPGCFYQYPNVQMVYPIPYSTGVPDTLGILVYGGYRYDGATIATPITLRLASAPPIDTVPTSLPSPIPTPTASALGTNPESFAAVAIPRLAPHSTYQVVAQEDESVCGASPIPTQVTIGSFATK